MRFAGLVAGLLGVGLVLNTTSGAIAEALTPTNLSPVASAFTGRVTDMVGATRNREFMSTPLTSDRLDGLRSHVGRDVSDRVLGSGVLEGRTVREMLDRHPDIASNTPQILAYLAARERKAGVRLYRNDQDVQPLDVREPGRIVPSVDLARAVRGGNPADRMNDYLQNNFGMDDNQVRAYKTFLELTGPGAAGVAGNGEPGTPGDQGFAGLSAIQPRSPGGLYVPSPDLLARISAMIAFYQEFRKESGADPSMFRGPDGHTIADFMGELDPDPNKRPSTEELRRMSTGDVRQKIMDMMRQVSTQDIQGPNKFLFDMGLAWVAPVGSNGRDAAGGAVSRERFRRTLGNGHIREENDKLYKVLILDELKPSQRDLVELDSMGDVFAIRGRPADLHQKHYDPPIDPEGLYFGSGMTLESHPAVTKEE